MGTYQERIQLFDQLVAKARSIIEAKQHDYSATDDVNSNFLAYRLAGIRPTDGVLSRMIDKLVRVSALTRKEAMIKDEGIEDSLIDLINYSVILYQLLLEEQVVKDKRPPPTDNPGSGMICH